ncbi:hypothetical protein KJ953_04055 [Patescibacteria group bacterium]|nr:hypothetical protein [Patescibacteria group bacterium]
MQLSKKKINNTLNLQLKKMFLGVLAEIKSPEEIGVILQDLLTETERAIILKRLGIAVYLDKGRSYENIKNNIRVSSATIAGVAESLGNPGFQEIIKRIKADQWAEETSGKIVRGIRKILPL